MTWIAACGGQETVIGYRGYFDLDRDDPALDTIHVGCRVASPWDSVDGLRLRSSKPTLRLFAKNKLALEEEYELGHTDVKLIIGPQLCLGRCVFSGSEGKVTVLSLDPVHFELDSIKMTRESVLSLDPMHFELDGIKMTREDDPEGDDGYTVSGSVTCYEGDPTDIPLD